MTGRSDTASDFGKQHTGGFSRDGQKHRDESSEGRELKKQKSAIAREIKIEYSEAIEYLSNGTTFLKYGRKGKPKIRHIFYHEKCICWREPNKMDIPDVKKGHKRHLKLAEIQEVREGRTGKIFDRFKLKEAEKFKEQFSFSIVSTKRTLDLEATVEIEARMFINFLRVLLANQKHQEEKFLSKSKIADKSDKANLD